MSVLGVRFDFAPYRRATDDFVRKQVPFSTALALTWTAKDAQAKVKTDLGEYFIVRRPWIRGGVRIVPASKTNLEAVVGHRDEFMAIHTEGGVRRRREHKLAIPRGVRKDKKRSITRRRFPGAMLADERFFVGDLGRGKGGVFRRGGRGGRTKLTLMWIFDDEITIRETYPFESIVEGVVARRWTHNGFKALERTTRISRARLI